MRLVALGLIAACSAPPAPRHPRPPARARAPDLVWDAGEFAYTQKGRAAGTETFAIERTAAGFRLRSSTMLEYADGAGRLIETDLATDAAWRPLAGEIHDAKDGVTVSTLGGEPLHLAVTVAGVGDGNVVRNAHFHRLAFSGGDDPPRIGEVQRKSFSRHVSLL